MEEFTIHMIYWTIRMKIQISYNITKERYQLRIRCFQIIALLIPQAYCVIRCDTSLVSRFLLAFHVPQCFPPTPCDQGPWDLMTSQARLWTRTPSPASGTMANVSLSLLLVGWHAWDTLRVSSLQILSRSVCAKMIKRVKVDNYTIVWSDLKCSYQCKGW